MILKQIDNNKCAYVDNNDNINWPLTFARGLAGLSLDNKILVLVEQNYEIFESEDKKFLCGLAGNEIIIKRYLGEDAEVVIPSEVSSFIVSGIGRFAFGSFEKLKRIVIPETVKSIDINSFGSCTSLSGFEVSQSNHNYTGIDGVLFSGDKRVLVKYPQGSERISYDIPCGVEILEDHSFESCFNLESVHLPASIKNIGYGTFSGCINLKGLTIPESVVKIEDFAFVECTNIKQITLPASIKSLGMNAFNCCDNISKFDVAENNPCYASAEGVLFTRDMKKLIKYPTADKRENYLIPYTVTSIAEYAFVDTEGLNVLASDKSILESVRFSV